MNTGASERAGRASRGTTQTGVRLYNERLVLSLIRKHQSLPKAEIARQTGLSAQTVSVIVRQLEGDGLLQRETPQRGKVGQPLVPFSLNPDGAYSIGLKVGRRSVDLLLMDLAGAVRNTVHKTYRFPEPGEILSFVKSGLVELTVEPRQAPEGPHFRPRHRRTFRTVELGRRSGRTARRSRPLARLRFAEGNRRHLRLAGAIL